MILIIKKHLHEIKTLVKNIRDAAKRLPKGLKKEALDFANNVEAKAKHLAELLGIPW
jgi:gas vesicle protein